MTQPATTLVSQARAALAVSGPDEPTRADLEHLIADLAAETLLLEVERLRVDRAMGPAGSRFRRQALRERRAELDRVIAELRETAGDLRARLGPLV